MTTITYKESKNASKNKQVPKANEIKLFHKKISKINHENLLH